MQEDEIQLLKSALADVVRRLNVSEEQQAMGSRRGPTKGNRHKHVVLCFSSDFSSGASSNRVNGYLRVCFFSFSTSLFPDAASFKVHLFPSAD